jgi:sulfur relay (sulfurtransferase) DsrF/TusC family protein
MEKIIKEFWIKNEWLLERYEEDYGLNGRDYILSVDDIEELEEILENYL